jgi:hypothetical protein
MKTVRFSEVVKSSGKPDTHLGFFEARFRRFPNHLSPLTLPFAAHSSSHGRIRFQVS